MLCGSWNRASRAGILSRVTTQTAAPARRRRAALAITLGVVVVLLIGFFLFAGLYTDALWFGKLGYSQVLYTEWLTIATLFVIGFLAMAVPVIVTVQLAYRLRRHPWVRPRTVDQVQRHRAEVPVSGGRGQDELDGRSRRGRYRLGQSGVRGCDGDQAEHRRHDGDERSSHGAESRYRVGREVAPMLTGSGARCTPGR